MNVRRKSVSLTPPIPIPENTASHLHDAKEIRLLQEPERRLVPAATDRSNADNIETAPRPEHDPEGSASLTRRPAVVFRDAQRFTDISHEDILHSRHLIGGAERVSTTVQCCLQRSRTSPPPLTACRRRVSLATPGTRLVFTLTGSRGVWRQWG